MNCPWECPVSFLLFGWSPAVSLSHDIGDADDVANAYLAITIHVALRPLPSMEISLVATSESS